MKQPVRFGKYLLLERVNVGGMAEVFKAKAFGVEGFERLIAVKRILPNIAEDAEFISMFVDEAKIAVQLNHTNIAQVFELGKASDSYFIAMEYVRGKDLRAIFDRAQRGQEPVPVPMAAYVIMKLAEGLDYAHNKRDASGQELHLVHRDVSPQNILVSYDGEVKIVDFGVAKATGKAGKTQAGILKGKFSYMSPEQVRGLPLDRRSDVFAVGIILYELLTAQRLFTGESDFSTLEKVRNAEVTPPSHFNRRVPEELEHIVLRTLAKNVDDRYQTAMDLHDDLQSFMYSSGNFFARRDLTSYMHQIFAEDIAREAAREDEYRQLEMPDSDTKERTLPEVQSPGRAKAQPASLQPDTITRPRPGAGGGVGGLASEASVAQGFGPSTLLGMPKPTSGSLPPPGPLKTLPPPPMNPTGAGSFSSPPPAPPPASAGRGGLGSLLPPAPPLSTASTPNKPAQLPWAAPPAASVALHTSAAPPQALEMNWDEENLATQIFDKDESSAAPSGLAPLPLPAALPRGLNPSQMSSASMPSASAALPSLRAAAPAPIGASPPGLLGAPPTAPLSVPPPSMVGAPPGMLGAPGLSEPYPPAKSSVTFSAHGAAHGALPPPGALPREGRRVEATAVIHSRKIRAAAMLGNDRNKMYGLAALGVVLLGALLVWILGSDGGAVQLMTDPPDAIVMIDRKPIADTESPFTIEDLETDTPHILEVTKTGYQTWTQVVQVKEGETILLPPLKLQPGQGVANASLPGLGGVETGFSLESEPPGATVRIDGREITQRTPVRVVDLTSGEHHVTIEAGPRYQVWETKAYLNVGQVLALPKVVLSLRAVTVSFMSEPSGAFVSLVRGGERRNIGPTPISAEVQLTGRAWTVEMNKAGYQSYAEPLPPAGSQESIQVRGVLAPASEVHSSEPSRATRSRAVRRTVNRARSERTSVVRNEPIAPEEPEEGSNLENELPPGSGGSGTLRVNTRPWSQVFVDGRLIGNTPQMNIRLPAGTHRITLVNTEFSIRQTITVTIRPGETLTKILSLKPPGA